MQTTMNIARWNAMLQARCKRLERQLHRQKFMCRCLRSDKRHLRKKMDRFVFQREAMRTRFNNIIAVCENGILEGDILSAEVAHEARHGVEFYQLINDRGEHVGAAL